MCRHVVYRLPGQCLEICSEGDVRHDQDAEGRGLARTEQILTDGTGAVGRALCPCDRSRRQSLEMAGAYTLAARAAVGLKPGHFRDIIAAAQPVGFFEVHAENYMGAGGEPHAQLGVLRERYALSLHGVGLSIGSMQPLDRDHLERVKLLCDRY